MATTLITRDFAPYARPHIWPREDSHAVRADVRHDTRKLTFVLDLPGVRREDIDIDVRDGVLTIGGVRHAPKGAANACSSRYGSFHTAWRLPANTDIDRISASLDAGVLTVVVPKVAAPRARNIQIGTRDEDWWSRARKWLRDAFR